MERVSNKIISLQIKLARKRVGISQTKFAELLNMSRTAVTDWERKGANPRMYADTLYLIAQLTDTPIERFFSVTEKDVAKMSGIKDICKLAKKGE